MPLFDESRRNTLQRFAKSVKRHLLWTFIAYGIGAGLTWYYRVDVFAFLLAPAQGGLSLTDGRPIFIAPTEMFASTIHLALKGGLVFAVPVVIVSLFRLLSRFLMPWERRSALLFLPALLVSYVAGIVFAYYVLLPTGLRFLLSFGTDIATPTIRISEYLSLVTAMLMWLGLVFELPLFMFIATKFRLVSFSRLWRINKIVPVSAIILAGIITPTFDGVNLFLVAVPLIVLYQVGLILAWIARPTSEKKKSSLRRALGKVWSALIFLGVALILPALLIGMVAGFLWYKGVIGG